MNPLPRHPFRRPLTVISLILLAACVVFWHRGNRNVEIVGVGYARGRFVELASGDGTITLAWQRRPEAFLAWMDYSRPGFVVDAVDERSAIYHARLPDSDIIVESWATFQQPQQRGWDEFGITTHPTFVIARSPFWPIMLPLTIPPLFSALHVWKRRRRIDRSLCAECGYDLRHSKHRCPECGTPIPADENSSDLPKTETPVAS